MESTGYWNDFISNAKTFFPFPLRFYDENIFEYAAFCLFLYASISRFTLAISDLMPKTDRITFLPPATKLGQGYVFTRVCDSVHRGVSQHALQQVSRGCAIPACIAGGIPACLAAGLQGGAWGGGSAPGGAWWRHPPPGTATAVGGTHPTGMHSCYISDYILGNITFFVNLQVKASWRFENFSRSAYCLGRRNCWTIILEKVIKVMKGKETFYH